MIRDTLKQCGELDIKLNKKKIIIAASVSCIGAFLLWLVVDVYFNGKVREYTYNKLLEYFSQGWEQFRLFIYVIFFLMLFLLVILYFVFPNILVTRSLRKEKEKLRAFLIGFFEDDNISEIDNEYIELKEVLLKQKIRLVESEHKRNEMISNIAHDLKTPLTSILGYLMLLDSEEELPESIRKKYTGICVEKTEQLNSLINEFFELSTYSSKSVSLNASKIDITQLLEQLIDEFYPMLLAKKQKIVFNYSAPVYINADGDKLCRALENIIKNAVSYSNECSSIDIQLDPRENKVFICISNECGFLTEQQLNRIFDRSYRIDDSRKFTGNGGIGLSIAKEIIDAHGGNINADYSDGRFIINIELGVYLE